MKIIRAKKEDMKEILDLQYIAYQSEAKLTSNYKIQPLLQTYEEILAEYDHGIVLKAVDDEGNILGSVRGRLKDNILHIGKLIVNPIHQGKGIGTRLLAVMEEEFPEVRKELFTSEQSIRNIKLYQRSGYQIFKIVKLTEDLNMVYLYKF